MMRLSQRLLLVILTAQCACQPSSQETPPGDDAGPVTDSRLPVYDATDGHADGASSQDGRVQDDATPPDSGICVGTYLPAEARAVPAYPHW